MQTFSAQVSEHVRRYKQRMDAVFKESAQEVVSRAQTSQPSVTVTGGTFVVGKIPVGEAGFLRDSLISGINGSYSFEGPESYVLAIAGADIGDTIQAGWTAEYAPYVEYGTKYMDGRFFLRANAQQWQQIVNENSARLMGR